MPKCRVEDIQVRRLNKPIKIQFNPNRRLAATYQRSAKNPRLHQIHRKVKQEHLISEFGADDFPQLRQERWSYHCKSSNH